METTSTAVVQAAPSPPRPSTPTAAAAPPLPPSPPRQTTAPSAPTSSPVQPDRSLLNVINKHKTRPTHERGSYQPSAPPRPARRGTFSPPDSPRQGLEVKRIDVNGRDEASERYERTLQRKYHRRLSGSRPRSRSRHDDDEVGEIDVDSMDGHEDEEEEEELDPVELEQMDRMEKARKLVRSQELERQGYPPRNTLHHNMSHGEIDMEIMLQEQSKAYRSKKDSGRMVLISSVNLLEKGAVMARERWPYWFVPELDGWGKAVYMDVATYDDTLVRAYDLIMGPSGQMHPFAELPWMLAKSAFMYNLSKKMGKSQQDESMTNLLQNAEYQDAILKLVEKRLADRQREMAQMYMQQGYFPPPMPHMQPQQQQQQPQQQQYYAAPAPPSQQPQQPQQPQNFVMPTMEPAGNNQTLRKRASEFAPPPARPDPVVQPMTDPRGQVYQHPPPPPQPQPIQMPQIRPQPPPQVRPTRADVSNITQDEIMDTMQDTGDYRDFRMTDGSPPRPPEKETRIVALSSGRGSSKSGAGNGQRLVLDLSGGEK